MSWHLSGNTKVAAKMGWRPTQIYCTMCYLTVNILAFQKTYENAHFLIHCLLKINAIEYYLFIFMMFFLKCHYGNLFVIYLFVYDRVVSRICCI